MLSNDVLPKDENALKSLIKIEFETLDEGKTMKFDFYFEANEYFSNAVLTKKIHFKDEENPIKSEGTEIQWAEGKNLTKKTITKKQKNKKTGQ